MADRTRALSTFVRDKIIRDQHGLERAAAAVLVLNLAWCAFWLGMIIREWTQCGDSECWSAVLYLYVWIFGELVFALPLLASLFYSVYSFSHVRRMTNVLGIAASFLQALLIIFLIRFLTS